MAMKKTRNLPIMSRQNIVLNSVLIGFLMAVLSLFATSARAVIWTDWTSVTAGSNGGGSATGSVGGVGVSYSGELDSAVINGSSSIWAPDSSFIGGTVTASPSVVGDDLRLNGSSTGTNTLTFASAVENPVFAIWSLGRPSFAASFIFDLIPTLQAGGPNSAFGGGPLAVSGNTVSGNEGNGVVQFTGTFSSISWTNTPESFYAFTVGVNGPLGPGRPTTSVPEPASLSLLALAFVGLLISRLGKRRLAARRR